MAPVGVSMSPTGDFLGTAHVDSLGVYLWSEPITSSALALYVDDITALESMSANHSAALLVQDQ